MYIRNYRANHNYISVGLTVNFDFTVGHNTKKLTSALKLNVRCTVIIGPELCVG